RARPPRPRVHRPAGCCCRSVSLPVRGRPGATRARGLGGAGSRRDSRRARLLAQRRADQAAPRASEVRGRRRSARRRVLCPRPDRRPHVNDLSSIAQLAATSDEQAARLLADSTHADLIARITATRYHASERSGSAEVPSATRPLTRRRLTIGLPAAAAVVAAALVISSSGQPGHHLGPTGVRPTKAELLSFTRHGRYIDVIVRNPLADAKKYNAEFKAHGLHITLSLVPASTSLVGTLVYFDGGSAIHPITAVGKCWTGGGGSKCPVRGAVRDDGVCDHARRSAPRVADSRSPGCPRAGHAAEAAGHGGRVQLPSSQAWRCAGPPGAAQLVRLRRRSVGSWPGRAVRRQDQARTARPPEYQAAEPESQP